MGLTDRTFASTPKAKIKLNLGTKIENMEKKTIKTYFMLLVL